MDTKKKIYRIVAAKGTSPEEALQQFTLAMEEVLSTADKEGSKIDVVSFQTLQAANQTNIVGQLQVYFLCVAMVQESKIVEFGNYLSAE